MTSRVFQRSVRAQWGLMAAVLVILLAAATAATTAQQRNRPAPLPEPTEAQLGVPPYPGAKFDGVTSAGMSQGETKFWIYTATDAVAQVAKFYEEKTKVKPQAIEGAFLFVLKGEGPFPEHGVMVEPNKAFGPPAKTVVTIIKNPSKR